MQLLAFTQSMRRMYPRDSKKKKKKGGGGKGRQKRAVSKPTKAIE